MKPVGTIRLKCPNTDNCGGTYRGTEDARFCPRCFAEFIDLETGIQVSTRDSRATFGIGPATIIRLA